MEKQSRQTAKRAAQKRALEREKLRRTRELRKLHQRLEKLSQGDTQDHPSTIYDFYLEALNLPEELRLALHTLARTYYYDEDGYLGNHVEDLLEDLLINGKSSSTYRNMHNCWKRLGIGKEFSWNPKQPLDGDVIFFNYRSGGTPNNPVHPLQVAEDIAKFSHNSDLDFLWEDMQQILAELTINNDQVPRRLVKPGKNLLQVIEEGKQRIQYGSVPIRDTQIHWLLDSMEYLSKTTVMKFLRCADEYNWEWAMASFDWSQGREPKLIPALQSFVDTSPWSTQ